MEAREEDVQKDLTTNIPWRFAEERKASWSGISRVAIGVGGKVSSEQERMDLISVSFLLVVLRRVGVACGTRIKQT